jgi:hypothetical protein
MRVLLLLLLAGSAAVATASSSAPRTVHAIPHAHSDMGWKKTATQYYTGSNGTEALGAVKYILTNAVNELLRAPARTFTHAEMGFFWPWFVEQDAATQAAVQGLVSSGRLEFIGGGYTQYDEATTSYVDMLDQQTLGLRWIRETFGVSALPTVQAAYDPFGHTVVQALLSSPLAGYTSVFWGRISFDDQAQRVKDQGMEWIWSPSPTLGDAVTTFAGTLPIGYGAPNALYYDNRRCYNQQPTSVAAGCVTFIQDDPALDDYNADVIAEQAVEQVDQAYFATGGYRGADAYLTAGGDFAYENALEVFSNFDKAVALVNSNTSIHGLTLKYSTPSAYVATRLGPAAAAANLSFPSRAADIIPYASSPDSYWSGFYTSRPALKHYIRLSSAALQAARQLAVFTNKSSSLAPGVDPLLFLETGQATAQHHDAVTGTERQHVAFDYARRIARGRIAADVSDSSALQTLVGGFTASSFSTCDLANATICPSLEAGLPTLLNLYNSRGQTVGTSPFLLPVGVPAGGSVTVLNASGTPIPSQLLPLTAADVALRETYYGTPLPNPSAITLMWLALQVDLPPAGFTTVFITPSQTPSSPSTLSTTTEHVPSPAALRGSSSSSPSAATPSITNSRLTLTFSQTTGLLSSYSDALLGLSDIPLNQTAAYYVARTTPDASGAYVFRPNGLTPLPLPTLSSLTLVTGPVVSEARLVYGPWFTQVLRLWAGADHAELQYTVGPIPVQEDGVGKEVVTRLSVAGWDNAGSGMDGRVGRQFAADSNCREMLVRTQDSRDWPNFTVTEPVAGNFYPVTCAIQTWDAATGNVLTVATDRTHAGTGMYAGSVELMLHRRLLLDDNFGVNEALDEPGLTWGGAGLVSRGTLRFAVTPASATSLVHKSMQQAALFPPRVHVAPLGALTPAQWLAAYSPTFSGLATPLPPNLHLATLHSWAPGQLLVRLAHLYDAHDAALGAVPASLTTQNATVDLASLFLPSGIGGTVTAAVEMTLTGMVPLASVPQVQYRVDGRESPIVMPVVPPAPSGPGLTVTLSPMQIRCFLLTVGGA